jgi:hypothetical protein
MMTAMAKSKGATKTFIHTEHSSTLEPKKTAKENES